MITITIIIIITIIIMDAAYEMVHMYEHALFLTG
jgi:hypothetical protein